MGCDICTHAASDMHERDIAMPLFRCFLRLSIIIDFIPSYSYLACHELIEADETKCFSF